MTRLSFSHSLFFLLSALLYGYGDPTHSADTVVGPTEGKALVVFVRTLSSDATSVDFRRSPVFELKSGASVPELVGILSVRMMVAYQIDPGMHLFMVVGENADFMTADVLPNRI